MKEKSLFHQLTDMYSEALDVEIMKKAIPASMQVKASGGVRSYEDLMTMVEAGATRIGASAGIAIMEKAKELEGK